MKRLVSLAAALLLLGALLFQAQAVHAATIRIASPYASVNTNGGWNRERLTWYGPGFYNQTTACGVTMTRKLIGVAARSDWMPCGTQVEIRVHRHGHVVHDRTVTVIDHGPYGVPWHLDATSRLMRHLTGHPPHSLSAHRVKWRVVGYEVW